MIIIVWRKKYMSDLGGKKDVYQTPNKQPCRDNKRKKTRQFYFKLKTAFFINYQKTRGISGGKKR